MKVKCKMRQFMLDSCSRRNLTKNCYKQSEEKIVFWSQTSGGIQKLRHELGEDGYLFMAHVFTGIFLRGMVIKDLLTQDH